MEEKDLTIEVTEEPAVEETVEEAATEDAPVLKRKRKLCCKKESKPECREKNPVCAVIAIAAACCTVLAAAGCALWFWKKCCEDKQ